MFTRTASRFLTTCLLSVIIVSTSFAADLKTTMQDVRKVLKKDASAKTLEKNSKKLRDALKKHPEANERPRAQLLLARLRAELGEFHQAASILERLREEKPENLSMHDVNTPLVHALIGKGEYLRAVEITNLLLKDKDYKDAPRRPELIHAVAYVQESILGNVQDAAELYARLLEDHPDSDLTPKAAIRAGYLQERKVGNTKKAVQTYLTVAMNYPDFEGVPALNPGVYSGWRAGWRALNLAGVAHNKPRYDRGLADFEWQNKIAEKLVKKFPEKAERIYTFMMNSALLEYGRRRFPNDGDGKKQDIKKGLKWARKALKANPNNAEALRTLALHAKKNRQKYVAQYIGNDAIKRSQVADLADSINSMDTIQKALEQRPGNVHLLHRALTLALKSNKSSEAKKYANKLSGADAVTRGELDLIGEGTLRYGKQSGDLNMLLKLADTPRYPWNVREKALRASVPLLAKAGKSDRMIEKLRQYIDTYSYMYVDKNSDTYSNVVTLWQTATKAYDSGKEAFEALRKLNKSDLFKNGVALHETLRWELGRLAFNMGRKDMASRYFDRHYSNDDLAADCWIHYFQAAQENNAVLTQLKLAAEVSDLFTTGRWKDAKKKYVDGVLQRKEEAADMSADQQALVKILRKDIQGADIGTLREDYNTFLSKHEKSAQAPWVLIHVTEMLRNTAGKKRLPAFGKWLMGWSSKIDSSYWKSRVLVMAGELYSEGGDQPTLPNIRKWSAIGPFPAGNKGLAQNPVDPGKQPDLSASMQPAGADKKLAWQEISTTPDGLLDFAPHFMPKDRGVACAVTFVKSPEQQKAQLYTGMAGPAKIWLNGNRLLSVSSPVQPYEPNAYVREITLKKGINRIQVTSLQNKDALKWGVNVRLADLKKPVKASPTPKSKNTQSVSASPSAERQMKSAFRQASALASGLRKKKLLLRPFEALASWGRHTEARAGYRHLIARCGAMAQEKLAMSYRGWNDPDTKNDDPYVSRKRFLTEITTYLQDYRPGDRYRLLNNFLPYAKDHIEEAFTLTDAYLQQHPGDWPLIQALWDHVGGSSEARQAGVEQTLGLVNKYPGSPWIINVALKQFNTNNPELLKRRYEATKLTKHKLEWLDHWYKQAGRSVMKKVKELEKKRRKYVNRADKLKKEAREATKDAQQLLREAKSFERKIENAQQNK